MNLMKYYLAIKENELLKHKNMGGFLNNYAKYKKVGKNYIKLRKFI